MRSNTRSLALFIALLASSTACREGDTDRRDSDFQIDSGEIASAAAEAIVATLRRTTLSDTAVQRRWILAPGPTPWDTLLAEELRRAEPSIASPADDTTVVTTMSTHGFASRGDTVDVTVVVRSCQLSDTLFSFTKDSVVHRLVRERNEDNAEWRQAGPVSHDHAVGECEPTPAATGEPPSG